MIPLAWFAVLIANGLSTIVAVGRQVDGQANLIRTAKKPNARRALSIDKAGTFSAVSGKLTRDEMSEISISGKDMHVASEKVVKHNHNVSEKDDADWKPSFEHVYCPFSSRRRVSSYQRDGCAAKVPMAGSKCWTSCDHPNMELHKAASWWEANSCKCKAGYQQGPDGHGTEGICIPCGCLNLASESGFLVDLCPAVYDETGSHWITAVSDIKDNMKLPSFDEMKAKILDFKDKMVEKGNAIMTSIGAKFSAGLATISGFAKELIVVLHELHAKEFAAFQMQDDGIWDVVKDTWDKVWHAAQEATRKLMDAAKANWDRAKEIAARAAAAAKAVAAAVPGKIRELSEKITATVTDMVQFAQSALGSAHDWLSKQWEGLMSWAQGKLTIDNFKVNLVISNPTMLDTALHSVSVDVDYSPDTSNGGGHWGGIKKFDLGNVHVDHSVRLKGYGSVAVDVWSAVGSLSIDIVDILKHGLGFLEDMATGKLTINIGVKNLQLEVMGANIPDWLEKAVTSIASHFTEKGIPIELEKALVEKAESAVAALNHLWGHNVTAVANDTMKPAKENSGLKISEVKAAGEAEAEQLEDIAEEKQAIALEASQNETAASKELSDVMQKAAGASEKAAAEEAQKKLKEAEEKADEEEKHILETIIDTGRELLTSMQSALSHIGLW